MEVARGLGAVLIVCLLMLAAAADGVGAASGRSNGKLAFTGGGAAPGAVSRTAARFTGGFVVAAERDLGGGALSNDLYLVRAGRPLVRLTSKFWVGGHARISPNGRLVAFEEFTGRYLEPDVAGIVVLDLKTREARRLPRTQGMLLPAWSPRGDRLLVAARSGFGGLMVMKADGSQRQRLTHGRDTDPAWAPDGRRIAFIRFTGNFRSAVFIANASGGGARRLTPFSKSDHSYTGLIWRPHPSTLAYGLGDVNVHTVTLAGRRRTLTASFADSLTWFGGREVAFIAYSGAVEAVSLDSGRQRLLFDLKGLDERNADWSARL